jgi:hypothetical protein
MGAREREREHRKGFLMTGRGMRINFSHVMMYDVMMYEDDNTRSDS